MRDALVPCSQCCWCPGRMREGGQLREVLWAGNVHSGGSRVAPELAGRQGCGCIAGKPSEGGRKSYVPVVQGQGQRAHRWQALSKGKEILCASRAGLCVPVRARRLLGDLVLGVQGGSRRHTPSYARAYTSPYGTTIQHGTRSAATYTRPPHHPWPQPRVR